MCRWPWLTIVLALTLAGCVSPTQEADLSSEGVGANGSGREQRTLVDFERKRDEADYQIALARWSGDDTAGCESTLLELLRRNPDHREARLMLADLYVSTNKPAAAEKHLRLLLENDDDARAHHALGLLLEISGKSTEALTHFQRAQTLEPGNELYAASYAAAQTTAEPTAAKSGRRVALATLGEKGRPRSRDAQAPSDPVAGEPQAKW